MRTKSNLTVCTCGLFYSVCPNIYAYVVYVKQIHIFTLQVVLKKTTNRHRFCKVKLICVRVVTLDNIFKYFPTLRYHKLKNKK